MLVVRFWLNDSVGLSRFLGRQKARATNKPQVPMKLLRYVALIFIDVFGITHPSVEARDRAARYIACLLLLFLVAILSVLLVGLRMLSGALR